MARGNRGNKGNCLHEASGQDITLGLVVKIVSHLKINLNFAPGLQ